MDLRPLFEWVFLWAADHDVDAVDLEARVLAHLEELGEIEGVPRGSTREWVLSREVADRLLAGLTQTGDHDRL